MKDKKYIEFISDEIRKRIKLKEDILQSSDIVSQINESSSLCIQALRQGNKILLAGNGGSAGDAQHIAGELVNRFNFDRPGLPAISLTTDTSVITAIANDYDYNSIFSRQIDSIGNSGDIFFAISTSGNSENILKAAITANKNKIHVISLTGVSGGELEKYSDIAIKVPSKLTPEIQEIHIMIAHLICTIIEIEMFG
ncbi:SIS domain-containing protein [Gammaproteobacteria bacterium]|nr:SIS domain-containing protein [Gammaproteobacteria bacterium]